MNLHHRRVSYVGYILFLLVLQLQFSFLNVAAEKRVRGRVVGV
jgi:hypothetical protein